MRTGFVCAALVAAIGVCVPATAAQQLITFTGLAGVSPSGTPIAALQQFAGATVVGAFLVDTAARDPLAAYAHQEHQRALHRHQQDHEEQHDARLQADDRQGRRGLGAQGHAAESVRWEAPGGASSAARRSLRRSMLITPQKI